MRNIVLATNINKLFRIYWFIVRPKTRGVKALIFNKGNILMVRLTYYPNTWTFPGGGVHRNEDILKAVIRECREEVGIELKKPERVGEIYSEFEYKKDTVYIFREDIDSSEVNIDRKEIIEAAWYQLNELPVMGKNAKGIIDFTMRK